MTKYTININTIDKVKSFVNDIQKVPFAVLMSNGRYTIDAKSIMGIFSLDLNKPVEVYPAPEAENISNADMVLFEEVQCYI